MFKELDNWDLQRLLKSIRDKRLGIRIGTELDEDALFPEVCTHEKRISSSSHIKQLNRLDLVSLIYAMLYTEIKEIDTCPEDVLPMLINKEWSCPQLHDRLLKRMRGEGMIT